MVKTILKLFPTKVGVYTKVFDQDVSKIEDLINKTIEANSTARTIVVDSHSREWAIFFDKINMAIHDMYPKVKTNSIRSWINIIRPGVNLEHHDHINYSGTKKDFTLLTTIYYPKYIPGMGNIMVFNNQILDKLLGNRPTKEIDIVSDSLIILPGWMAHQTMNNLSDKLRISLATDYTLA